MTTAAVSRRGPGPSVPSSDPGVGGTTAAEEQLVLLMCGTRERRDNAADTANRLLQLADPYRLAAMLGRLRLTGLVGSRLLAMHADLDPRVEDEIKRWTAQARAVGRTHELATLAILEALESASIRALSLKGTVLAREVYGDIGMRSPGDIDVLVAADHLTAAIAVLEGMGWTHQAVTSRTASLPVLHETLSHPSLPRVELHWRVHWYETRFAADALANAERDAAHEPLIMRPADGLAALVLFYARDGFAGLRMPADVAAWWDAKCTGLGVDQIIEEVAVRYPELGAALRLGTELLGTLVGLPTCQHAESLRLRVAGELATPFLEVTLAEARAKVGLVDLLLAPPGGTRASVRRERQKVPAGLERPLTPRDGLAAHRARWEHLLRMLRRWALALAPAALRARRSGSGPPSSSGQWGRA